MPTVARRKERRTAEAESRRGRRRVRQLRIRTVEDYRRRIRKVEAVVDCRRIRRVVAAVGYRRNRNLGSKEGNQTWRKKKRSDRSKKRSGEVVNAMFLVIYLWSRRNIYITMG